MDDLKEIAWWAYTSEVISLQDDLKTLPNEKLIMLGLSEIIAFMPKSEATGATREALWRELWRRGTVTL